MAWFTTQLGILAAAMTVAVGAASVDGPSGAVAATSATYKPPPVYPYLSPVMREAVEGTNPSLAQKVLGYDAWVRAHGGPPHTLILGTSRSVMLDPAEIERRTGTTAYNAGISNGATREFDVMTGFADLRSPGALPNIVLLLDLESFDNRAPTRRVRDYERRIQIARAACREAVACRHRWQLAANAIARDARARQNGGRPYRETQLPNGRQINGVLEKMERQGVDLRIVQRHRIAARVKSYGPGQFDHLYAVPRQHFERFLALANARGVAPHIVITGMLPACIRICGPAGWSARRAEVKAYLRTLDRTYDFTWADLSLPSTWGGSSASFYDEIHLRPAGASLVVGKLIKLGAFR